MAKCKCPEVECEECPEWIFTLADLLMCMMGLFVIMWVLKPGGAAGADGQQADPNWIKVVASIREAFGYVPDPKSSDPVDLEILARKLRDMDPLRGPGQGAKTNVRPDSIEGTHPEVEYIRPGQQSIVGGRIGFEPGSATLSETAARQVDQIAGIVRGHRNIIIVKGHASLDDMPEGADQRLLMELSLRRAATVSARLAAAGVAADTLRIQGCSTHEPVVERVYGTDRRTLNRRAEIVVSDKLVEQLQGSNDSAPTTMPTASAGN